jgi:hypothetical protein
MSQHQADKALIYRGRLDINKSTDIFQAVINYSISNPPSLKFDYLQQPNHPRQFSSVCHWSTELATLITLLPHIRPDPLT